MPPRRYRPAGEIGTVGHLDDVELATLGWVHWHNNHRLHGYLGDLPPTEFEGRFYATQQGDNALVEIE